MGLYNGAVITSAGQSLLAQAISGTELTWTAMRASSVAIPEGTDLTTLTALTGIEQTTDITDASVYGSNVVQASARFSNTGISEAYLMETIGIYGQVTGGSETLIAVMTAETPDEMPAYDQDSPSAFIFNVQMSVQNANSLTMVVNDTGTATVADLRRKVDLNGGDLSDTVVDTFTASIAEYPVPAAGDTMRVIGGKIAKFCADIMKTFTGASASAAGKKGLVPAPAAGRNTYYLRGDGTWQAPVNDNTTTVAGRVLDARQANPNVSGSIAANVKSLNDSLANCFTEITIANAVRAWKCDFPLCGLTLILFTTQTATTYALSPWIDYVYSANGRGITTDNNNTVSVVLTNNDPAQKSIRVDPNYGSTTKYNAWITVWGKTRGYA